MIDGKFLDYRSDRKGPAKKPRPIGSRMGPQNMVCTAWALQTLKDRNGFWEKHGSVDAGCTRVHLSGISGRPVPGAPLDSAEPIPFETMTAKDSALSLSLLARHDRLIALLDWKENQKFEIFNRPDAKGEPACVINVSDREIVATNTAGEKLQIERLITPQGENHSGKIEIPYAAIKSQKSWATAIEGTRWSIRIDKSVVNICIQSREAELVVALQRELSGGLRTWEAIFDEKGYIPTGMGTNSPKDNFSDTGGYAHLISATAQYILLLEGKKDCETLKIPAR
jgi:hypothetical protein